MELQFKPRLLQAIGKSLYVALPNAWVKTLGLKKGDKVSIIMKEDGSLEVKNL
jgi:antitoxin component of MazEF toxin-antitoxin module